MSLGTYQENFETIEKIVEQAQIKLYFIKNQYILTDATLIYLRYSAIALQFRNIVLLVNPLQCLYKILGSCGKFLYFVIYLQNFHFKKLTLFSAQNAVLTS